MIPPPIDNTKSISNFKKVWRDSINQKLICRKTLDIDMAAPA